ncbi:MAG TPA: NAD(P)H-hydrate dehydratase [Phycisphaerae bacterium]|nr:NAD(P)H-hydrate dehydratase [Phycisphaerae bacterium]
METIELPRISRRREDSHKGDYGRVLIIAGSENMIGAPALAALAALRTGSGLCRIATVKEILPFVLSICPCATGYPINARDIKGLLEFADQHDAVAVGPGLGLSTTTRRIVLDLLERHSGPMVLDADALNTLSALEASEWPKRRDWGNVVLTPHMGEFMRLMAAVMKRGGTLSAAAAEALNPSAQAVAVSAGAKSQTAEDDAPSTADGIPLDLPAEESATSAAPQAAPTSEGPDRSALAELLSRGTGCVVVLKGHNTVVADGLRIGVNQTGNPGMATAGAGDVLTGVIASLLGQGFASAEAALLGVHIHGTAGDLAAEQVGPAGLLATDVIQMLPKAVGLQMH